MTPNHRWVTFTPPEPPKPYATPLDDTHAAFGRLLRSYREAAGLSQNDLGERAGFTYSYISRLETGDRAPSIALVNALARALRLTPEQRGQLFDASGLLADLEDALALLPDDVRRNVWAAATREDAGCRT